MILGFTLDKRQVKEKLHCCPEKKAIIDCLAIIALQPYQAMYIVSLVLRHSQLALKQNEF